VAEKQNKKNEYESIANNYHQQNLKCCEEQSYSDSGDKKDRLLELYDSHRFYAKKKEMMAT